MAYMTSEMDDFLPFAFLVVKVENILKGSLDLIPSPLPSVKIQIMGGKVCLRCKGKTLLGVVNKLLKNNKFGDITRQQCFALLPQVRDSKRSRANFKIFTLICKYLPQTLVVPTYIAI